MQASYVSAASCTVAGDQTAAFVAGVRVQADCGTDGLRYGTVAAAAYASGTGLTTVTIVPDAAPLTASLAGVLHGNDVPASLCHHGHAGPADGGTVAHGALSGAGSNSHAAIDAFIATRAQAQGLASLDDTMRVVQNPASATTTPMAGKMPIADAFGRLTSWIEAATTAASGVVQLATNAIALAGTDAAKAVTAAALWYVLALATRLRISANTTLSVATTGSDTTGDGSAGAPFATIAKALSSIAGKTIDAGVTVTIQVADGVYTLAAAIALNHPDIKNIKIQGNMSAETLLPVSSIDTAARALTFTGADYTGYFAAGDRFRITTGTEANKGAYTVASVTYADGNTVLAVNEALASSAVGGASVVVMPCNKCVLQGYGFTISNGFGPGLLAGFRIVNTSDTTGQAVLVSGCPYAYIRNCMFVGFKHGVLVRFNSFVDLGSCACVSNNFVGIRSSVLSGVAASDIGIGNAVTASLYADGGSYVRFLSGGLSNNGSGNTPSPAYNTVGNSNSYIANA